GHVDVCRVGHATMGLAFHNEAGIEIGRSDASRDEERFGSPAVLIPRGALGRILRERGKREGIPVEFGKRLAELEEGREAVRAVFEDGTEASSTLLVRSEERRVGKECWSGRRA